MYVVAITRWASSPEEEARALAPVLGVAPYDLKLRLGGPLPVVVTREADAARARELLQLMRTRGHGAIGCDLAYVPSSEQMPAPRSYRLEDEAFVGLDPAWGERAVRYADLLGLVHASAATLEESTAVTQSKKFSLGRAVLTGGLVMRKKTTSERRDSSEQREQVLYLIRQDGRDPMILREQRLRHQGLGARAKPTSPENFATLITLLRERAPGALFDDRLFTRPRRATTTSVSGTAADRLAASSNASDNDLAAHLIVVAHRQRQL
jgi:hypothetical protein